MKRCVTTPVISLFALLMVMSCTAHAQRSPLDGVRESRDPGRAAEVERKAEAISGRRVDSLGESGEGGSGGKQGAQDEMQPAPESSGDSGSKAPDEDSEDNTNRRLPLDLEDSYY